MSAVTELAKAAQRTESAGRLLLTAYDDLAARYSALYEEAAQLRRDAYWAQLAALTTGGALLVLAFDAVMR